MRGNFRLFQPERVELANFLSLLMTTSCVFRFLHVAALHFLWYFGVGLTSNFPSQKLLMQLVKTSLIPDPMSNVYGLKINLIYSV